MESTKTIRTIRRRMQWAAIGAAAGAAIGAISNPRWAGAGGAFGGTAGALAANFVSALVDNIEERVDDSRSAVTDATRGRSETVESVVDLID